MKIGATPYVPPQTTYQAARAPLVSTDDNPQSSGSTAATLDFSNMTRSEMRDAIRSLTKSGQMSMEEASSFVGMLGMPALVDAGSGAFSAARYEQEHINAFSLLQTGIEGAKSRHDDKTAAAFQQSLSALQRLQGALAGIDMKV